MIKKTLGLTAFAALAIIGAASIGFANEAASKTTASAPGINEGKTALFNHAPPTNITIALQSQDTAGTFAFAPLAIPDPTLSEVTSKTEANGISAKNENTGITAAHSAPPTNVNAMKTATTLATNGNAAPTDMVNATHAPNTGTGETVALGVTVFFGTGQVLLGSGACRTRP